MRHVALICALLAGTPAVAAPDFADARDEALAILRDLVRIDTSNPPGNETKVADYLKQRLSAEGIDAEIVGADPNRGNLIARVRGGGAKRPLLLMGHTDVVGVERDKWTVDPFAAEVRDGFLYGRGATDDKDSVAAFLVAMLLIHRAKLPLERDVIFVAEASEEGGANQFGIGYLIAQHWSKIEAELALAEGGVVATRNGDVRYVGIATTEKMPTGMTLTARGTSGHGSVPRPDNPIVHLSAAVAKIGAFQSPMRLNETTREFFKRLARISAPGEAAVYRRLEDPNESAAAQAELYLQNLAYHSMLRTSISPNVIDGGFRYNVIPAEATATLDVRALPGEDVPALMASLNELIDDPAVELTLRSGGGGRPAAPPSPLDNDLFQALERAQQTMYPKALTLPMMLTGATDMAQLRAKGVAAYGVAAPAEEGELRAHGNDERIDVDALGKFVEFVYRAVVDVAVKDGASGALP
jgi:acetylornithine deacetylase/succinyl-diaminopimelate desuccinylase-like protein